MACGQIRTLQKAGRQNRIKVSMQQRWHTLRGRSEATGSHYSIRISHKQILRAQTDFQDKYTDSEAMSTRRGCCGIILAAQKSRNMQSCSWKRPYLL